MEYQGDIGLYLSGCQVPIKMCGMYITQPKVRDIVQFGESDFFAIAHILSDIPEFVKEVKEGNSVLKEKPDFQIFIGILGNDKNSQVRRMFDNFMELCFSDFRVDVTKKSINFKVDVDGGNVGQVNPFNFREFSRTIKELFMPKDQEEDIEYNIDPNNKRAVEMLKKIEANRRKRKEAQNKEGGNTSIFAHYTSILSIGMNMDINVFYNYTPFQLYNAFDRYLAKFQYDIYQKTMMTPFVDTSKIEEVESWLVDIYRPKKEVYNNMADMAKLSRT